MKKRMTEAAAILLSLATLASFSACAGKKSDGTSEKTTVATTQSATESGNAVTTVATNVLSESASQSDTSSSIGTTSSGTTQSKSEQTNSSATALQTKPPVTVLQTTTTKAPVVEYFVEYKDTRLAKYFKDYDMNNVYIKMSAESKGVRATKEFGSKDGYVYSSLEDEKTKLIYLSTDRVTYLLYEKEKTYTIHALGTMSLSYVYDGCIGAGESEFDGKKCIYEAFYDNQTGNVVCHLFSEKGVWLGYEEYDGTELKELNRVVTISKEIPSHLFFKVPLDYEYYYSDTIVTIPSDWNE